MLLIQRLAVAAALLATPSLADPPRPIAAADDAASDPTADEIDLGPSSPSAPDVPRSLQGEEEEGGGDDEDSGFSFGEDVVKALRDRLLGIKIDNVSTFTASDFEGVLTSDLKEEFGLDETSAAVADALWKLSSFVMFVRGTKAEVGHFLSGFQTPSLDDIQHPYVVCSTLEGASSFARKEHVFESVSDNLRDAVDVPFWLAARPFFERGFIFEDYVTALQTVHNTAEKTCFLVRLRATSVLALAYSIGEGIRFVPVSPAVKIRRGVVQEVMRRANSDFDSDGSPFVIGESAVEGVATDGTMPPDVDVAGSFLEAVGEAAVSLLPDRSRIDITTCPGVDAEDVTKIKDKVIDVLTGKGDDNSTSKVQYMRNFLNEARDLKESLGLNVTLPSPPKRVRFWTEVMLYGIDSDDDKCEPMLAGLDMTSSPAPAGDARFLTMTLGQAVDPAASVACVLAVLTATSMLPQVCSCELGPEISLTTSSQVAVQGGDSFLGNIFGRGNGDDGDGAEMEAASATPFWDEGITGKGQVVAVSDSGLDTDNCYFWDSEREVSKDDVGTVDMENRKVVQYFTYADDLDEDGHGTHCAAIIAGHKSVDGKTETDGMADGIAKDAKVAFFDLGRWGPLSQAGRKASTTIPADKGQVLDVGASVGAKIHSASWGGRGGSYNQMARQFDQLLHLDPDMLLVVAAGNTGYDGYKGEFDVPQSMLSPAISKNVLSVGASNAPGNGDGIDVIAYFSSRGPTPYDSIGPHVIAPGNEIESAGASPTEMGECDSANVLKGGTSMACPAVAGTAALARQYFMDGFSPTGEMTEGDQFTPSAYLLKAVLINGGQAMSGVDNVSFKKPSQPYDSNQGFGRVSLLQSLPLRGQNWINALVKDREVVEDGATMTYEVTIDTENRCTMTEMRATLVWVDPPGTDGCTKCLINDLDLLVTETESSKMYFPNGRRSPDTDNNVERVIVTTPKHGDKFTISVTATNLDREEQEFALIVTGCITYEGDRADLGTPLAGSRSTNSGSTKLTGSLMVAAVALLTSLSLVMKD